MIKKINKFINYQLIIAIILILLGIFLVLKPDVSVITISYMIGILLIVNGICLLALDIRIGNYMIFVDNFVMSIMSILFGIIILCYPAIVSIIVPVILGIWFIAISMFKIRFSFILRSDSVGSWILTFIMAILSSACGIILIIRPMESITAITFITGILLIVYSISDIVDMLVFKKNINSISKRIKKSFKTLDME